MANILVAHIPPFPFAFFRITHYKTPTPSRTLPYRALYDSGDLTALLTYLNNTYKPANGFLGTFTTSGNDIIYVTAPSESYGSGLFETDVFTKYFRLHVDSPSYFTHYLWTWGVVVAWGDGTADGFMDLINQTRVYPTHTYSTPSQHIDYFHTDSASILICDQPEVTGLSGTMPKPFSQFVIRNSQIRAFDITTFFEPCRATLHHIELRNNMQLSPVLGLDKPWTLMDAIDVRSNGLSSLEVDRVFITMYRAGLLNPALQTGSMVVLTEQDGNAPPTPASLPCRQIMQEQWHWTLTHD